MTFALIFLAIGAQAAFVAALLLLMAR